MPKETKPKNGFVWIVGAGPGDARLLTLKAKECLEQADVIVYDRLVTPSVLSLARPDAELIYAGKTPNGERTPQEWINEVLVNMAKEGKKVVRLKNGDPFVFGRGAEEAEALADAGIPFEIVPGVSSAFAVPAYAGIPLTDRRFASQFSVGTGKSAEREGKKSNSDFRQLAKADTVVALMAVGELEEVVSQLIEGGKSPDTLAAIIEWGATPHQKVLVAELGNLPSEARKQNVKPPAVLIVGEVVRLREKLIWYERKPLFGKRILFPCTDETKDLASKLEDLGAEVVRLPVAKIATRKNEASLQRAVKETLDGSHNWVLFTDELGVHISFERVKRNGSDLKTSTLVKFAAVNQELKDASINSGIHPDLSLGRRKSANGSKVIVKINGNGRKSKRVEKLLALESVCSSKVQADELYRFKMRLGEGHTYTIVPNLLSSSFLDAVLKEPIHIVVFASAPLAKSFFGVLGNKRAKRVLENAEVWVVGSSTEQFCRQQGVKPSAVMVAHTFDGLLKALTKRK